MTLDNIKHACIQHFSLIVGECTICSILAGEQGPSCALLDQIPDLKVVYISSLEPNDQDVDVGSMTGKRKESPSKAFPKSNFS